MGWREENGRRFWVEDTTSQGVPKPKTKAPKKKTTSRKKKK